MKYINRVKKKKKKKKKKKNLLLLLFKVIYSKTSRNSKNIRIKKNGKKKERKRSNHRRVGEFGVLLHCHCSQVHSDTEW